MLLPSYGQVIAVSTILPALSIESRRQVAPSGDFRMIPLPAEVTKVRNLGAGLAILRFLGGRIGDETLCLENPVPPREILSQSEQYLPTLTRLIGEAVPKN